MTDQPVLLKVLLRRRHLQGHTAFKKEYDKIAAALDRDLIGSGPGKAQFYRWLNGDLLGLPYAHHCRVLEKMFPEWTAEQLFQPYSGGLEFVPEPAPATRLVVSTGVGDLTAVYASRSDFMHELPPRTLFDGAREIRMAGLSLNLLCQQYPDSAVIAMLEAGTTIDCLFLDPDGAHVARRNEEEGHAVDTLSTLTRVNIDALRTMTSKLTPDAAARLRVRTYDETIRFNITLVDNTVCVVQPYLPHARGVESPTLVMRRNAGPGGLYDTFAQVLADLWDRAAEVSR